MPCHPEITSESGRKNSMVLYHAYTRRQELLSAAGHTILKAKNYPDISKSSNREFCWYSNTQEAQPRPQD